MNTIYSKICKVMLFVGILLNVGCLGIADETIMLNGTNPSSIPDDEFADESPNIDNPNIVIPNINPNFEYEGTEIIARIDMGGILKPNSTDEYIYLRGTGDPEQNVWLDLDDKPKGFVVYNASDGQFGSKLQNDFVFLIDNSGSMDDEADAIAKDIVDWASKLSQEIDIRFAIVGYDGLITGAINFTDYEHIAAYLNRPGITGTDRTVGFTGEDAEVLKSKTGPYNGKSAVECGMAALHYAHDNFAFRKGANRIYVNFTDEPNSVTNNDPRFSVEYLNNPENWSPEYGTIHTVFSNVSKIHEDERSVLMSTYTGGTIMEASSDFKDVSLDNLPVTGAMQHAYIFKFGHLVDVLDDKVHNVRITIYDDNGNVRAVKSFGVRFNPLK